MNVTPEAELTPSAAVGELAYNSTVTNTIEFLPVTLSFIAAKNCVSVSLL